MVIEKDGIYYVGRLKLDTKRRELWLNDEVVNLSPQRFDLLHYLIHHWERNVTKDDLLENVWKGVFVEETNITRIISQLRDTLGDESISTERGVGYRFNPRHFIEGDNLKCPWRGFRFYDEANEDFFCGREEEVDRIINKLQTNPFLLTLTGPSGVGKTSLVKAGLVPKLKRQEISIGWKFISLRPTHRPLFELSRKIAYLKYPGSSLTDEIIDPIIENLRNDHKSIIQELNEITDLKLFLFIDQIETLLSKEITDSEADIFVEFLLELSETTQVTQAIVLGLRRDFYDQFCKRFNKLSVLITDNMVLIEELSENQLKRVIDEPARRAGLDMAKGLSECIVKFLSERVYD